MFLAIISCVKCLRLFSHTLASLIVVVMKDVNSDPFAHGNSILLGSYALFRSIARWWTPLSAFKCNQH